MPDTPGKLLSDDEAFGQPTGNLLSDDEAFSAPAPVDKPGWLESRGNEMAQRYEDQALQTGDPSILHFLGQEIPREATDFVKQAALAGPRAGAALLQTPTRLLQMQSDLAQKHPALGYLTVGGLASKMLGNQAVSDATGATDKFFSPLETDPSVKSQTPSGDVGNFTGTIGATTAKAAVLGPAAIPVFAAEAAGSKYKQAKDENADTDTAALEAGGSGLLNAGFMALAGKTAPSYTSLKTAIVGQALRGVAGGTLMGVGENALSRLHNPNVGLTDNLGHSIATMIGFEGAGLIEGAPAIQVRRDVINHPDGAPGYLSDKSAQLSNILADAGTTDDGKVDWSTVPKEKAAQAKQILRDMAVADDFAQKNPKLAKTDRASLEDMADKASVQSEQPSTEREQTQSAEQPVDMDSIYSQHGDPREVKATLDALDQHEANPKASPFADENGLVDYNRLSDAEALRDEVNRSIEDAKSQNGTTEAEPKNIADMLTIPEQKVSDDSDYAQFGDPEVVRNTLDDLQKFKGGDQTVFRDKDGNLDQTQVDRAEKLREAVLAMHPDDIPFGQNERAIGPNGEVTSFGLTTPDAERSPYPNPDGTTPFAQTDPSKSADAVQDAVKAATGGGETKSLTTPFVNTNPAGTSDFVTAQTEAGVNPLVRDRFASDLAQHQQNSDTRMERLQADQKRLEDAASAREKLAKQLAYGMNGKAKVEKQARAILDNDTVYHDLMNRLAQTRDATSREAINFEEGRKVIMDRYGVKSPEEAPSEKEAPTVADTAQQPESKQQVGYDWVGRQRGAVNIGDMADALKDAAAWINNKLGGPEKGPDLYKLDLTKMQPKDQFDNYVRWYLERTVAPGLDKNGVPLAPKPFWDGKAASTGARDFNWLEKWGHKLFSPSTLQEGGLLSFKDDPVFKGGESPVSEIWMAKTQAAAHEVASRQFLMSALLDHDIERHSGEIQKAIKPLLNEFAEAREKREILSRNLGKSDKAKSAESMVDAVELKRKAIEDELSAATDEKDKERLQRNLDYATKAVERTMLQARDAATDYERWKKQGNNEALEGAWRKRLADNGKVLQDIYSRRDAAMKDMAQKYPDARVFMLVEHGTENPPDWLKQAAKPNEMEAATKIRDFMQAARGNLEEAGVPTIRKSYMPRYWAHLLSDKNQQALARAGYLDDFEAKPASEMGERVKFREREQDSKYWVPDAYYSLDGYASMYPRKLYARQLADRWDSAINEMKTDGKGALAQRTQKLIHEFEFGEDNKLPFMDKLTNSFYTLKTALSVAIARKHGMKALYNIVEHPITTFRAIPKVAEGKFGDVMTALNNAQMTDPQLYGAMMKAHVGSKAIDRAVETGDYTLPLHEVQSLYGRLLKSGALNEPTRTVEALDRGVTLFASLLSSADRNLPPADALKQVIYDTMMVNFIGHDKPDYMRGSIGRAVGVMGVTPQHLMEYAMKRFGSEPVAAIRDLALRGDWETATQRMGKTGLFVALLGMLWKGGEELVDYNHAHDLLHAPPMVGQLVDVLRGKSSWKQFSASVAPLVQNTAENMTKYGAGSGLIKTATPSVVDTFNTKPSRLSNLYGSTPDEKLTRKVLGMPMESRVEGMEEQQDSKLRMQQRRARAKENASRIIPIMPR